MKLSDAEEAVEVALRDVAQKARELLDGEPRDLVVHRRMLRMSLRTLDLADEALERARDAEPHMRRSST